MTKKLKPKLSVVPFDYWISFRLDRHPPNDQTYDDRVEHIYDVIDQKNAISITTSFYAFKYTGEVKELIQNLSKPLLKEVDSFVLKDVHTKDVYSFGSLDKRLILFLDEL